MLAIYLHTSLSYETAAKRNKCSAVAGMGDRLATIDMGRKEGAALPLSRGSSVPI